MTVIVAALLDQDGDIRLNAWSVVPAVQMRLPATTWRGTDRARMRRPDRAQALVIYREQVLSPDRALTGSFEPAECLGVGAAVLPSERAIPEQVSHYAVDLAGVAVLCTLAGHTSRGAYRSFGHDGFPPRGSGFG
jgi:hypothetical protein